MLTTAGEKEPAQCLPVPVTVCQPVEVTLGEMLPLLQEQVHQEEDPDLIQEPRQLRPIPEEPILLQAPPVFPNLLYQGGAVQVHRKL